jgi:putative transposase
MKRLFITRGTKVKYQGKECIIIRVVDVDTVSIEEVKSNIIHTVKINEVDSIDGPDLLDYDLKNLTSTEWEKATKRYEIIKPILRNRGDQNFAQAIADKNKIGIATIYRWLKIYDESGLVSSLAGKRRTGGKGKSRLSQMQEDIIYDKINDVYLNSSKKSITKTIREIQLACDQYSIKCPHPNTIRNRIRNIPDEEKVRKRYGIKKARDKYEPIKGEFPNADYPLSVIQIDHTPVDIILVDEQFRKPLKRPWLTLAIDVYSRMVVGYFLSFETPGFLGTGMCISNSILPKEMLLDELGIKGDWPCWGIMDKIHVDNAKEFRSNMLEHSCLNYGIDLEFRPVATPHYGGHVERLLGAFSEEIHNLPGTTFSSTEDRENYNSSKNASFTLKEFEKWLITYIVKVYHKSIHSTIKETPYERYKKGILGNKNNPGIGIPPIILDTQKVRLDFMPYVERSVQEYGVVIDHIYYYSDVLRAYIHDTDGKKPRKHLFRRDPRDISVIYFFDYKNNQYYDIPYRDTSLPPISIWEHREIIKKLKETRKPIDEKSIFAAFRELNEMEDRAIRETRNRKRNKTPKIKEEIDTDSIPSFDNDNTNITPFEDIDDEAFNRES